jgi:hypothetical protein
MRGLSKAPIKEKINAPPKNTRALASRLYSDSNNKKVEIMKGDITPVKFMIPRKSNFIPEPRVDRAPGEKPGLSGHPLGLPNDSLGLSGGSSSGGTLGLLCRLLPAIIYYLYKN